MIPKAEKQPSRARPRTTYTAEWGIWTRRSLPRSEWAKTNTKYSCFIDSPERTPFWIRGAHNLSPGVRWGYYCYTTIGEPQTVTANRRRCQPLQHIEIVGIVAIARAQANPWNAVFAESGGAAQPPLPTGTPRF